MPLVYNNNDVDMFLMLWQIQNAIAVHQKLCYMLWALLNGNKIAATAIDLMRSRYSAYVLQHVDYLIATTHRSERKLFKEELLNWASSNTWLQLEIIDFIEKSRI
jgi:uncharacterized protein YchJ